MFIVRPVKKEDLNDLYEISALAKAGLTTLPHDREVLEQRIDESVHSFSKKSRKPSGEMYFFVLEDTRSHKVIGTSAILSKVGGFEPFYTYKIKSAIKQSKLLNVRKKIEYLKLVKNYSGPSEVATLFLLPTVRQKGVGRLLSLSRFLFVAQYPFRFESSIIAEMRGVVDDQGQSPFWNSVGKHFFEVDFQKADLMVMRDKSFIEELIPEHPIYIPILPLSAQAVIGKVHKETEPALHLLESEGFSPNGEIDIFEGGLVVEAKRDKIRTVKESQEAVVSQIIPKMSEEALFIIANVREFKNFRATMGPVIINEDKTVTLTEDVAKAIEVKKNTKVRLIRMKKYENTKH